MIVHMVGEVNLTGKYWHARHAQNTMYYVPCTL